MRLLARFLRQLGLADALFQLVQLVAAFLAFAQFLLDRLELFVEIVLALRLLHLALDAAFDLALDLQHADLGFDQRQHLLQPLGRVQRFQQRLAVGDLDRQMRGHRVGELAPASSICATEASVSAGTFLLSLMYCSKLVLTVRISASVSLRLADAFGNALDRRLEEIVARHEAGDAGAALALDQHAHRLVGQLEKLQHGRQRADGVQAVGRGIVVGGVLLGQKQNLLFVVHHLFEGAHGFLAAHEQGNDHMGKHDDVAQRQAPAPAWPPGSPFPMVTTS